jgi:hypothetical protein
MVNQLTRVLLALLLLAECADRLAAGQVDTVGAVEEAPVPDDDSCFAPLAMRYRQEAVQRVSNHLQAWTLLRREDRRLSITDFADRRDQVGLVPLADLDPLYAFMCLRR